ncbi:RseA family anti-sigma factor [Rhodoferax sp.]|uniref:RseA family anti-sigma factor n=1 Tax=Rhodoferax sp. TaxID=50421 RepID=UPI0025F6BB3D|nr:RseA family anti-sigma factor [Rhodoferax sp.]
MDSLHRNQSSVQEQLSALADGELQPSDIGALLDTLERNPEHYAVWTGLHTQAAVARGESVSGASGDLAFWQALQGQLALESSLPVEAASKEALPLIARAAVPANDSFWKARRLASVALVLAVGGMGAILWPGAGTGQMELSANQVPPVLTGANTEAGVMLRDPQLDALMAAHQQMGGHSAWQGPSGFLRNATYERPAR